MKRLFDERMKRIYEDNDEIVPLIMSNHLMFSPSMERSIKLHKRCSKRHAKR